MLEAFRRRWRLHGRSLLTRVLGDTMLRTGVELSLCTLVGLLGLLGRLFRAGFRVAGLLTRFGLVSLPLGSCTCCLRMVIVGVPRWVGRLPLSVALVYDSGRCFCVGIIVRVVDSGLLLSGGVVSLTSSSSMFRRDIALLSLVILLIGCVDLRVWSLRLLLVSLSSIRGGASLGLNARVTIVDRLSVQSMLGNANLGLHPFVHSSGVDGFWSCVETSIPFPVVVRLEANIVAGII